jgi:hypothetical protein
LDIIEHPLVLPFLAQIALTIAVLLWLAFTRVSVLVKKGGMAKVLESGFPARAEKASDNFKNQFELPVLFLALCLFAIVTGIIAGYLIILSWVFVGARVFHAGVQLGPNIIFPWRFGSFVLSAICVVQMLIVITFKVLS